jgi:hypothetical protein
VALRIIIFRVGDPRDKGKPDDIVLPDEKAQDPDHAGEPEPLVQSEEQGQKNKHHRVDIRIEQRKKRIEKRKEEKKQGFPDGGVFIDLSGKKEERQDAKKRKDCGGQAQGGPAAVMEKKTGEGHGPVIPRDHHNERIDRQSPVFEGVQDLTVMDIFIGHLRKILRQAKAYGQEDSRGDKEGNGTRYFGNARDHRFS